MIIKLKTPVYLFWGQHKNLISTFFLCLLSLSSSSEVVEKSGSVLAEIRGNGVVTVKAKNGYRFIDARTLFLEGDVLFESVDWKISGDKMSISGHLNNPEAIAVEGSPAMIESMEKNEGTPIKAVGRKVRFDFLSDRIFATGDASLETDSQSLAGPSLVYSYETGKITSVGSQGRVKFHSKR